MNSLRGCRLWPLTLAVVAQMAGALGCGDDGADGGSDSGGSGGSGGSGAASSGGAPAGGGTGDGGAAGGPIGEGGAGGDGGGAVVGSAGCGVALADPTEQWVEKAIDARPYFVYLPPGYDPSRAYPVVYQFHGCSGGAPAGGGTGDGGAAGGPIGEGGAGGDGGGAVVGSAGCGVALADPTEQWVEKAIDARPFFVYLPPGYDPARAYPVVYQFHGCSDSPNRETNNPPVQDQSGGDAIHVRGRAVGSCWDTSGSGPDVAYFDAMVAAVEAGYCADGERRFATGYSSGSFMTHLLSCVRGDVLRGVATIAGGMGGSGCSGQVAALLIHDSDDPTVNVSQSIQARDRYLAENGCGDTTIPYDPSPCVAYEGCASGLPVVWCQTSGMGHSRQDGLAAPAFWSFLSDL